MRIFNFPSLIDASSESESEPMEMMLQSQTESGENLEHPSTCDVCSKIATRGKD